MKERKKGQDRPEIDVGTLLSFFLLKNMIKIKKNGVAINIRQHQANGKTDKQVGRAKTNSSVKSNSSKQEILWREIPLFINCFSFWAN